MSNASTTLLDELNRLTKSFILLLKMEDAMTAIINTRITPGLMRATEDPDIGVRALGLEALVELAEADSAVYRKLAELRIDISNCEMSLREFSREEGVSERVLELLEQVHEALHISYRLYGGDISSNTS